MRQQFPTIRLAVPTRVAAPFDHPDWVFELKHDGFRALSHISDGRCDVVSRKNNAYKSFGPLRERRSWKLGVKTRIRRHQHGLTREDESRPLSQ